MFWRLINVFKRPMPSEATSMGVWEKILDVVVIVTIITNGAIAVFTTDQFTNWSLEHQLCLFIGFVAVLFTYKYILAILYSGSIISFIFIIFFLIRYSERSNYSTKKMSIFNRKNNFKST